MISLKMSPSTDKSLKSRIFGFVLFLLLSNHLFFRIVFAQEPTPGAPTDDQVNSVAKQLYCPVCENTPLDVCPTQACAEWRELIREKLAEGWSEEHIKQYFVDRFGDRALATPPAHGLNWLVYIVPLLLILIGFSVFYNVLRSWSSTGQKTDEDASLPVSITPDAVYTTRLEEELKENY